MQKIKFLIDKFRDRKFLFLGLIVLFFTILFSLASFKFFHSEPFVNYPAEGEYVRGEVMVSFRDGYIPIELEKIRNDKSFFEKLGIGKFPSKKISEIDSELKKIGIDEYRPISEGDIKELNKYYIMYYDQNIVLDDIQGRLSKLYFLATAEPNSIEEIYLTPNDPFYSQLWGMKKINAPIAWDTSTGSDSIIVAVIDTGVDYTHPDLASNVIPGRDFVNGDNDPMDDHGHGTHVAGTIGAVGNNNIGVAGANWSVKILPVKVLGKSGGGGSGNVNLGIEYAADQGANVANLSLGGSGACTPIRQGFINYALSKGVVVVVAAGNGDEFGNPLDASNASPASCNGVITVGSSTPSDSRASSSNFGDMVEIAAPGTSILSTRFGGGYTIKSGTSMAAPHVAGAAALLLSVNPGLSPSEVADCLINTADPISTDMPIGPRLNIGNAISQNCTALNPITPTITPTLNLTPTPVGPTPTFPPGANILNVISLPRNGAFVNDAFGTGMKGITNYSKASTSTISTRIDATQTFIVPASPIIYTFSSATGCRNSSGPDTDNDRFCDVYVTGGDTLDITFTYTSSGVVPTSAPTSVPGSTLTPVPTSPPGSTLTPTPTPITTYTCEFDPDCVTGKKNLQLCPLICTPN